MAYTAFDNDDVYQPRLPDLWDQTPSYAPTPGREWTPSVMCSSPDPERIVSERSSPPQQTQSGQLGFMREEELVGGGTHEERRLIYIHYQIEWRVKLNNRVMAKDTEQDLALPPSCYWERIKDTAGNVLWRKIARNRRVSLDDTNLVVSVNERCQSDLIKRFENASVDWSTVEKQLLI